MALHWEFSLFLALAASLFFFCFHQSRIQLMFLLIAGWIAVLFTPRLLHLIPYEFEYGGGILFLVLLFSFHILFRLFSARSHAEAALWWQVLIISFLMAGFISASLLTTFGLSQLFPLSPLADKIMGSETAMLVWLLLPLFGMVVLAKRPSSPATSRP